MSARLSVFVFIGPPGSGKGSLSQLCVQKLGWRQLSTGNLCRKHIIEQTEIGKMIDFAIKSGKLIPDSLITKMVGEWFVSQLDSSGAIILDGYPRTVAQAQALEQLLKTRIKEINYQVIRLSVSNRCVIERLGKRYICQNKECQAIYSFANPELAPKRDMICDFCSDSLVRRKDDEEDAVRERLKVYYRHEQALLQFYTQLGQLIREVDVEKSLENVFNDFTQMLELNA